MRRRSSSATAARHVPDRSIACRALLSAAVRRRPGRVAGERVGMRSVGCPHVVASRHPRSAPRVRLGVASRSRKRSGATPSRKIAAGEPLFDGVLGYEDTVLPAARERAARRPRRDLPRRARPGQDPHDPLAHRPARRVDADRRRQRDQRRPVRTRCRAHARDLVAEQGDDTPIEWVAPRRPLRREAGHARHVDRRPHRRGRPDQGRRGPLPLRRAHDPLRPRARAPTAASSPSTSCPTSPSASRSACSTCSRSATCRSAATRSACRSTSCSSRRPTPRTTPTAAASSRR